MVRAQPAACVALAAAWSVAAALAAPPQTSPPAASFGETVEVRVVNLEVTVTDHEGLPVAGLETADFRLVVDGEEEPIRYFTEVRRGTAVEPGSPLPTAIAGVPDLAPGEPVGTSYLVFIDEFFPLARDRDRVLEALTEDAARLTPEDRMAVVAFDGNRLSMLSSWTNSQPQLERAFRAARGRPAAGLKRQSERRNADSDRTASLPFPGMDPRRLGALDTRLDVAGRMYAARLEQQIQNEVSAVAAALRGFAGPPGRKVLLLLSGGWPYDIDDYVVNRFGRIVSDPQVAKGRDLYAPIIDTANQVGYTIFAVDVPGLAALADSQAEFDRLPELRQRYTSFLRETNQQLTLETVSRETGGRALLNSARLAALRLAESATRSYYWIGFVPRWQGNDRRHRVDVELRRAGLTAKTRSSFLDFSRTSEVSAQVESTLLFGSGPGTRPLNLEIGRPQSRRGSTMRVPISLSVPVAELTLLPGDEELHADLELRVASVDERGARSDIPVIPIRLRVAAGHEPDATAGFQTTLELRRLRNHLVVALYDPASGALWTASADVNP